MAWSTSYSPNRAMSLSASSRYRRLAIAAASSFLVFFVSVSPLRAASTDKDSSLFIVSNEFRPAPSDYSGAFSYSFPFTLPPGRGGVQPSLSLNYSSANADIASPTGYGWSLSIPSIQRLPKHGTDELYARHDFTSSASGELADVSLSDGMHGTYGAKYDDGSFLSYAYNADETWTVTDKRGTVYTYGGSANARVADPGNAAHVYSWYLTKVQDPNGNTVTYVYTNSGNQSYPSSINYTGNGSGSGAFDVLFGLESRSDVSVSRAAGFPVTTDHRINSVTVKVSGSVVRSYALSYAAGDNGVRSRLSSVTESGTDENNNTLSKPPTVFSYQASARTWTQQDASGIPVSIAGTTSSSLGVYIFDVNGDGLPDIVKSIWGWNAVYLNNGNNTWTQNTNWTVPVSFITPGGYDMGVRVMDVNGDGFQDLVYSRDGAAFVYVNNANGTGWTQSTTMFPPVTFTNSTTDFGVRFMDVDGDGLTDIVQYRMGGTGKVWINNGNGTGWTQNTNYAVPVPFTTGSDKDNGVRIADVNGDGLDDLIQAYGSSARHVWINKGDGTGWVQDTGYTIPVDFLTTGGYDMGVRLIDVNGDGLVDLAYARTNNGVVDKALYVNRGDGTGWVQDTSFSIPIGFVDGGTTLDIGVREPDVNGDMLTDILQSRGSTKLLYTANGKPGDFLTGIDASSGAHTAVTYAPSTLPNPNLFFPLQVVSSVVTTDGLGNSSTLSYAYQNGAYYYAAPFDRRFAGFGKVTKTDELGNVTVDYFHQGNATDSAHGEYADDTSKIGRQYREENYDNANHLYRTAIDKWVATAVGSTRQFVHRDQSLTLAYDGNADHVDNAVSFTYDTSNGNLTEQKDWGDVSGATDGTFTDAGSDIARHAYAYANWSSGPTSGYRSSDTLYDQSSAKVRETKWTYDAQTFGTVTVGNVTKESNWISGSTYADTQYAYDSYGFRTSATDPAGNVTAYHADSLELYPDLVTNQLSQQTAYAYDYSSGKVTQSTDPNGAIRQTVYDAFDRPLTEKQSDLASPSTLVTAKAYAYADSSVPTSVHETDYLDGSIQKEIYTYFDGLKRPIQQRAEAAGSSAYNVTDTVYDARGDVSKTSLPYAGSGSSRTTATTTSALYETTAYDPLHRVVSKANAAGTSTASYDQRVATETDADSHVKDSVSDAYGRLASVVEHIGGSTQTTSYAYDVAGDLVGVTDASGNVRAFTYDGTGKRLTAQDLHATSDTAYGTWSYGYDTSGRLTSSVSPVGITTSYSYDGLNRPLTENASSTTGTDVTYVYDSCTYGVGHLCSAAVLSGPTTVYTYDVLGRVASEQKTIGGTAYTTSYAHDRQGNVTTVTYPDNSHADYSFDNAGNVTQAAFTDVHGGTTTVVSGVAYGPNGKPTSATYGNGVTSSWNYDASSLYRLAGKTSVSGGANVENFSYGYDAVGNLTSLGDTSSLYANMSVGYGYDALNRLTSATSSSSDSSLAYGLSWTYDALGSLTSSTLGTYAYNGTATGNYANPHAVTSIGSTTLAYDQDGNLAGDGTWTNTWDYRDKLVSSVHGTTTVAYVYDHEGNRVSQDGTGPARIYPNAYYTVDGTSVRRDVLFGALGPVATSTWDGTAATTVYHQKDHLGGTHVETDSSGTVLEYILYKPFGDTLIDHKTGTYQNPDKFTGKEQDKDTGWYYSGARHQDVSRGVFLSEDPVFLQVGNTKDSSLQQALLHDPQLFNSYGYSRDNPVLLTDSSGKFIDAIADVAFMAYDLFSLGRDEIFDSGKNRGMNMMAFGLDTGALLIPGVTALGPAARVAVHADEALKAVSAAERVGEVASTSRFVPVISEQAVKGMTRAEHRTAANRGFYGQLKADSSFAQSINELFGTDVAKYMESGKSSLLNPPGTQWHHPVGNSGVVQLLQKEVHGGSGYQDILHPGGSGGFSEFYKQ